MERQQDKGRRGALVLRHTARGGLRVRSGRLMEGDAVDAAAPAATGSMSICTILRPRIEAGQQIPAMTVGPGIPELGSDDGAVDGQVVDVTGGKVRAAAELVVPPAQGGGS